MDYPNQRKLAVKLFGHIPGFTDFVQNEDNCFKDIFDFLKPHRAEVLAIPTLPAEWAYWWASDIGDVDHMRQFVTEAEWAYTWAADIGDEDHMIQFITEGKWAYQWARNIGDVDHMRQFVVGHAEVRLDPSFG